MSEEKELTDYEKLVIGESEKLTEDLVNDPSAVLQELLDHDIELVKSISAFASINSAGLGVSFEYMTKLLMYHPVLLLRMQKINNRANLPDPSLN